MRSDAVSRVSGSQSHTGATARAGGTRAEVAG